MIYEYFGLAYEEEHTHLIRLTPAGRAILDPDQSSEVMLRQLLKWQFPNNVHRSSSFRRMAVFPFEILLRVLSALKHVTSLEIAATFFTCLRQAEIAEVVERIVQLRGLKRASGESENAYFARACRALNPDLERRSPASLLDMADAFTRFAEYTGLVASSGRGAYTTLRVPARARLRFRQLCAAYPFELRTDYDNQGSFHAYYGDPHAVDLPWDRPESLAAHVRERAKALQRLVERRRAEAPQPALDIDPGLVLQSVRGADYAELREWNRRLERGLVEAREREFVEHEARTPALRRDILAKFDDLLAGNEDDAARWLEVNTWRSLVALDGDHTVVRRFRLEEDLTPRSFTPSTGNTPGMEYYSPRVIMVPEVSLLSGVRQWTNEKAAVVDHVCRLIEEHAAADARPVIGLFLAPVLNDRTVWQFFVLNQQSWRGEPVPVIPLEVAAWRNLVAHAYEHAAPSSELEDLVFRLHRAAFTCRDSADWRQEIARSIEQWKAGCLSGTRLPHCSPGCRSSRRPTHEAAPKPRD